MMNVLDENFPMEKINDYQSSSSVTAFMEKHSRMRQYSFQLMKCQSDKCGYCVLNPPRLPQEVFDGLHFLPDPVPGGDNHYKPFSSVYGTETRDNHRPALKLKPEATDYDKKHKSLFVAAKVRGFVQCCDCGKRRVVYAAKRLDHAEQQNLKRQKEEQQYVCGGLLFPDSRQDTLVVKEGINCLSPIETTYYADVTNKLPDICYHCRREDQLVDNQEVQDLKTQFGTVRPICEPCWQSGQRPSTRNIKKPKK